MLIHRRLAPHESDKTDVVLMGHSMGGLLSAEIALLPPQTHAFGRVFRHRILGTLNFDVPFLGMHPGVIGTGISSIFSGGDKPNENDDAGLASPSTTSLQSQSSSASGMSTFMQPPNDPYFNPKYDNDVVLPMRKGWNNALHFITKHSDGLTKATKQLVKSHMEFGGAMADYNGLKVRYSRIRALEEKDESARKSALRSQRPPPRIRFVNYYTASTGRPKKAKSPSPNSKARAAELGEDLRDMTLSPTMSGASKRSPSVSPRISVEEHRGDSVVPMPINEPFSPTSDNSDDDDFHEAEMSHAHPQAEEDDDDSPEPEPELQSVTSMPLEEPSTPLLTKLKNLPPLPAMPAEPRPLDLSQYTDKDARKLAEKDHARTIKAYKSAIKDRNYAIRDREKLEEKLKKEQQKSEQKRLDDVEKAKRELAKAEEKARVERQKAEEIAKAEKENEGLSSHEISERNRLRKEVERMERERRRMAGLPQTPPPEEEKKPEPETKADVKMEAVPKRKPVPVSPKRAPHEGPSLHATAAQSPTGSHAGSSMLSPQSTNARQVRDLETGGKEKEKKKKDRKFCLLPSKDAKTGERDPAWVRVFMPDTDEVAAHCSLFLVDGPGGPDRYERFVGDVADRIEGWVRGDV